MVLFILTVLSSQLVSSLNSATSTSKRRLVPEAEDVDLSFSSADEESSTPTSHPKNSATQKHQTHNHTGTSRLIRPGCFLRDEPRFIYGFTPAKELESLSGHATLASKHKNHIYLAGGCKSSKGPKDCVNQLLSFELESHKWTTVPISHSASDPNGLRHQISGGAWAVDHQRQRFYVWGGMRAATEEKQTEGFSSSLDYLDVPPSGTATWHTVKTAGAVPAAAMDASLTRIGNKLVVFGGASDDGFFNAVHYIDVTGISGNQELHWVQANTTGDAPSARKGHSAVAIGHKIYVYGGMDARSVNDDMHVLDTKTWAWSEIEQKAEEGTTTPKARAFHAALAVPATSIVRLDQTVLEAIVEKIAKSNLEKKHKKAVAAAEKAGKRVPQASITGAELSVERENVRKKIYSRIRKDIIIVSGGCDFLEKKCYGRLKAFNATSNTWIKLDLTSVTGPRPGHSHLSLIRVRKTFYSIGGCDATFQHCSNTIQTVTSLDMCPSDCEHGQFQSAQGHTPAHCKCAEGWTGTYCNIESLCPNKCSHHGFCTKTKNGTGVCECARGYYGIDCSRQWCANNCTSHGICSDARTTLKHGDKKGSKHAAPHCVCEKGYLGADCAQMDKETSAKVALVVRCKNHCSGRGKCKPTKETFRGGPNMGWGKCKCLPGFSGKDCSIECPKSCSGTSRGKCKANGQCECFEGYVGLSCEQTRCVHNCSHHGICVTDRCFCEAGFVGAYCQTDATCSHNGQYVNDRCKCKSGYGGPDCSKKVECKKDCNGHGKCVDPTHGGRKHVHVNETKDHALVGVCKCQHGYGGRTCQKKLCPSGCSGNGACNFRSGLCACYPGFSGDDCAKVHHCPKNCTGTDYGVCTETGKCQCKPSWTGEDCSQLRCKNDCSGHGECVHGRCRCNAGRYGDDCSVGCPNDCSGKGVCKRGGRCECEPDHTGPDCSAKKQCPKGKLGQKMVECSGQGICFAPEQKCLCRPGYKGPDCSKHDARCGTHGCNGRGTCSDGVCFCDLGYTGEHCERVAKCPADCNHRGFCFRGECKCFTGYDGLSCEKVVKDNSCPKNCSGHGFCHLSKCTCMTGYEGNDCSKEVGFCAKEVAAHKDGKVCSGRGVCHYGKCFCEPGSKGKHCQKSVCEHGCAKKQGVCVLGKCHCFPGWQGNNCTVPQTCPGKNSLPCSGRGICMSGTCACEPGYTGEGCEKLAFRTEECPKQCSNNGACVAGKCFCVDGYTGRDCSVATHLTCHNNCNSRGICKFGKCFCEPGWSGLACDTEKKCSAKCSVNGVCSYGKCMCAAGWSGADCDQPASDALLAEQIEAAAFSPTVTDLTPNGCPNACNQRGVCCNSTCACMHPYTGSDCSMIKATAYHGRCPSNCNSRGRCFWGKCLCDPGFTGQSCETGMPLRCPKDCSDHGICHFGRCFCDPGFNGTACEHKLACKLKCNQGVCIDGRCACLPGYKGTHCDVQDSAALEEEQTQQEHTRSATIAVLGFKETKAKITAGEARFKEVSSECKPGCSSNGVCHQGQCFCAPGYGGPMCAILEGDVHTAAVTANVEGASPAPQQSIVLWCLLSFLVGALVASVVKCAVDRKKAAARQQAILSPLINNA